MTKQRFLLTIVILSALTVIALSGLTLYQQRETARLTEEASLFTDALETGDFARALLYCTDTAAYTLPEPPADEAARLLYDAYYGALSVRADETIALSGDTAVQRMYVVAPVFDGMGADIAAWMQLSLSREVMLASRGDEIYTQALTFRPEVLSRAFTPALAERLAEPLKIVSCPVTVSYRKTDGKWLAEDLSGLNALLDPCDFETLAADLYAEASSSVTYVRKTYALPVDAHKGQTPDADLFLETYDPAEILALLKDPYAVQLIDGRDLYFHEDIPFIPGEPLRAYLDETILVIVWKEARYGCAETFSEIFIADASQLCRKIVDDTYDANRYRFATALAAEAEAVLAIGGDLYDLPGRTNGIRVYDGELKHFEQAATDTCFFTGDGEMLFAYRNGFASEEEAEAFVKDKDVRFSVCFGPVLIDHGVNVQPQTYPWGEINERYARGAIAKKDDGLHYLTLNMNQQGPVYWSLSLLSEQTETLLSYGVTKAYALDGGQTCCTIIGGRLVNRVQHDEERDASDIIFFATALPPVENDTVTAE